MKTLYLHIGTPKTGTTAIQRFCWQNKQVFENHGYCYPDKQELSLEMPNAKNGHFLVNDLKETDQEASVGELGRSYREGMETIVKLFEDHENIVLSDESIFRLTNGKGKVLWKELKADGEKYGFQIKVIVYLRRQDEFVASLWSQSIKRKVKSISQEPATKTWEEHIDIAKKWKHLDYFRKLESISEILGKENIIVRRYDRGGFIGNSIYVDFFNAINLDMTDDFVIYVEERNSSLYGNTCEMMRVLNEVSDLNEDDRSFLKDIMFIDGEISRTQYSFSMFSKEERREFLERYRKSNQRVAKEYLGEEHMFPDTIPDLPKWTPDNPYMYQDIIRIMALGFKQLREEQEKLLENQKKLHWMRNLLSRMTHAIGSLFGKKRGGGGRDAIVYNEQ